MNQSPPGTMEIEVNKEKKKGKKKITLNSLELNAVLAKFAQSNSLSTSLNVVEKVKVGPPASGTEGYMNEALPQYDGFVLDETRKLRIKPLAFLMDDSKYKKADLWIKDIGGAPLVFERKAPSAIHWTKAVLPTYDITLYRGAKANNDFPVDNHRFVFINDAKAGFNRFVHEWELYRRTTGTSKDLNKIYVDDETDSYFPLWHDHGSVSEKEAMPNAWYVGRLRVVGNSFVKQSLIWARLAHRAQVALRDGWSVYARYWDKKADGVTVYLHLHEELKNTKKFDLKELREKIAIFRLNFKPHLEDNNEANVTQSDLENGTYVSLGKHVLGFFELFVSADDFKKMKGVKEDNRPPPNQKALLQVLFQLAEQFVKQKSVSSVNVDKLDEVFLEKLATKMETDLTPTAAKTFRDFSKLVQTARLAYPKNHKYVLNPIQKFPMTVEAAQINAELKAVKTRKREREPPGRLPIFDDLIDFFAGRSTSPKDLGTITHVTKAKISTASIYKKRNPDQIAVMGLSATKAAESLWKRRELFGLQENFVRKAEWLHRSAFSYGGLGNKSTPNTSQVPGNLVFGTFDANTFMLRYESSIKNLSMLEEEVSDLPDSVVTTRLSYGVPWWPAEIADSQSWLAPYLHYEWEFNCTRVKLSSAEHEISLFSRSIPTLFTVYFDELVEGMLYSREVEPIDEEPAGAGSANENVVDKNIKLQGKIVTRAKKSATAREEKSLGFKIPPPKGTVDKKPPITSKIKVVKKKNTKVYKNDDRSTSPTKKLKF